MQRQLKYLRLSIIKFTASIMDQRPQVYHFTKVIRTHLYNVLRFAAANHDCRILIYNATSKKVYL